MFYVAGPVYGRFHQSPVTGIGSIYQEMQTIGAGLGVELQFPIYEPEVDRLDDRKFTSEMLARIHKSTGLVAVIAENDQSTPVEAAAASFLNKPICILTTNYSQPLPRLLRGLPGVWGVVDQAFQYSVATRSRAQLTVGGARFLSQFLRNPRGL